MKINWEIVDALSGWAAAAATFCAVLVSLKFARGDAPKLEIKAQIATFIPGPQHKIGIEVKNSGKRSVKLCEVYFRIGKHKLELSTFFDLHRIPYGVMLAEGDLIEVNIEFKETLEFLEKMYGLRELLKSGMNIRVGVIGVSTTAESDIDMKLQQELTNRVAEEFRADT